MEIPKGLIKKWRALKSHGDAIELATNNEGTYPELFNRAVRDAKCSEKVFKILAEYYQRKAELIKEYL